MLQTSIHNSEAENREVIDGAISSANKNPIAIHKR